MTAAMRRRMQGMVREMGRLRKHNRTLINVLDHYYEMAHHSFSKRRAEKLERKLPTSELKDDQVYDMPPLPETNQEFANRMKRGGR